MQVQNQSPYGIDPFKEAKPNGPSVVDPFQPGGENAPGVPKPILPDEADSLKRDIVDIQGRRVSPMITIPGAGLSGAMVGGTTGAVGFGLLDIAFGKSESVMQAAKTGAGIGAVAGFVSGAAVANLTDSKLEATLYGALSGAGVGALSGGALFKNAQAAVLTGALGAVSGAVSGFATSYWLGK